MNTLGVRPSFATGFAQWPGMSEYPQLWEGLEAAWNPFLGQTGNNLIDFSGKNRTGVLTGGDVTWGIGNFGPCLVFPGTAGDFVDVASYAGIGGTNPRTVIAWIKTSYNANDQVIVSWGETELGEAFRVTLDDTTAPLRCEVQGGYVRGDVSLDDNIWHMITVTWEDDGSPDVLDVKLYTDAVRNGIAASADETMNTSVGGNVRIGILEDETTSAFVGSIGLVLIYNRVLIPAEIKLHHDIMKRYAT